MIKYFFVFFLLLPLLSNAQANYKSGYAITVAGDTLRGYIDFKEWHNNPENINFKNNLSDKLRQLSLIDINYFQIDDISSYQKFNINISMNRVDISSPSGVNDTSSINSTVFLEILQKGKNVLLYRYTNNIKTRYYISDNKTNIPAELIYGVYQNQDNTNVFEKTTFRLQLDQLAYIFKPDFDKLKTQIQQAKYVQSDLVNIAAEINGVGEDKLAAEKSHSAKLRLFAGAAYNASTLKYSATGPFYGATPSNSSSPEVNLGIDVIFNPVIQSLILRLELNYHTASYNFTELPDPIYNEVNPMTDSFKLNENVFSISPQVIYNVYNTAKFKVFADVGYTLNFLPGSTGELTTHQDNKIINTTKGNISNYAFENEYSSLKLKAGVVINKAFEIYGAYYPSSVTTNTTEYDVNLNAYEIGVNYFFGKKN